MIHLPLFRVYFFPSSRDGETGKVDTVPVAADLLVGEEPT